MTNSPVNLGKYEMAQDGLQLLIASCQDDIVLAERTAPADTDRLAVLRERLRELTAADRRLRINTDSVTLSIYEMYGTQVRARLASHGPKD